MENNKNNLQEIKIAQVFESIQGEGRHNGTPMLFIRTSGCTRACPYCDTKYHLNGEVKSIGELAGIIQKSKMETICFTGGEPMMFAKELSDLMRMVPNKSFHIETNGDLISLETIEFLKLLDYIGYSPKEDNNVKEKVDLLQSISAKYDVKVVTDLKNEGMDLLKHATMLMPLTAYYYDNKKHTVRDNNTKQRVWQYCVDNNLKYACRSHIETWGYKQSGK